MRILLAVAIAQVWSSGGTTFQPERTRESWTGWFSDSRCARAPAADELVRPNGTACVKRCLGEGATPVFLSEQANAIFTVQDHPGLSADVGFRVEVVALVDHKAKTLSVRSVKRLSEVTPMCFLPRKKG